MKSEGSKNIFQKGRVVEYEFFKSSKTFFGINPIPKNKHVAPIQITGFATTSEKNSGSSNKRYIPHDTEIASHHIKRFLYVSTFVELIKIVYQQNGI